MPYNIPSYDSDRFSFGPGILYLGVTGSTPSVDIGAVRSGAELTIARERLDVPQGSPRTIVKSYAVQENVQLTVTGIEWNLDRLADVLGAGVTTSSVAEDTIAFGGDMSIAQKALKFVHRTPAGTTIEVYLWAVEGSGEVAVTFGDDIHEFPYTFLARRATTDWAGNSLSTTRQLFKIRRIK